MTSLRDRLRASTAFRHERADRAYSSLDLRRTDGLRTFLRAQLWVLDSIRCCSGPHAAEAEDLRSRMAQSLRRDLRVLDSTPAVVSGQCRLNATAMLYLLLGSSLGTQILRRRWQEAADPAVAAAGQYLGLCVPQKAWGRLCEELARLGAEGAEADRIVHDASRIFDLHLGALAGFARLAEGALDV